MPKNQIRSFQTGPPSVAERSVFLVEVALGLKKSPVSENLFDE